MRCSSCNQVKEYLERINQKGEIGIWFCESCLLERQQGIEALKAMSVAELDLVPYTLVKWQCQGKGCKNGTMVRDYGIWPLYFSHRFKPHWFNMEILKCYYMCAKHWKFFKQLRKSYPVEDVENKIFDFTKPKIINKNG